MTKWAWAQITILAIVLAALIAARIQTGPTPMVVAAWIIWGIALAITISGILLNLRKTR